MFYGGACNARRNVHAGLVCDLCESVLCVLLCDMPCARVVFGTSVFHFKSETGDDPFSLAAKPPLVQEPRGQSRGV